jgi:MFS family permease
MTVSEKALVRSTSRRTAVSVVFGTAGFGLASWLVRLPLVQSELHASTLQMGILAFGISAGSVVGFTLASRAVARFGPARVIWVASALAALGLSIGGIGASFVVSIPLTFAGVLLYGAGNGTCNVAMNIEGAAVEREYRRPIMPWFHACFSVGAIVGALAGAAGAFLAVPLSLHLGIVSLLMVLLISVCVRSLVATDSPGRREQKPGVAAARAEPAPVRRRMRWPRALDARTVRVGVVVLGMSFANGAANDWIAIAMVNSRGVSQGFAALTLNLFTVAIVVARVCGVPVLRRVGRVRAVQGSAVLALAGILMFIAGPTPPWAIAGAVLWGAGVALGFPIGMSAAGDDPEEAPSRISLVASLGYAGTLVGPPLIGFVAEGVGIRASLLIVLGLVLVAGLSAPVLRERRS